MKRREAVQYISILLGATIVGSNVFLEGCKSKTGVSMTFTPGDISLLDEIAETILPTTKTPGAKAAKVGQFMTVMVNDCYEAPDQKIFHEGLAKLDDASQKKNGKSFLDSSPQERHDLLVEIDKNANAFQNKASQYYNSLSEEQKHEMTMKKNFDGVDPLAPRYRENPDYYFILMKQLTLLGYFTSEIGCTQARRYVETPGKYEGCIPYTKGDKAWAL
jgi:hypothetical protein